MNRVLLAIGGLLVGLLAILFAAPAMVDWNRYRGIFEEEATRLLGREVRVGGRVNLRLLPVPVLRFEQVRVADTTASVGRPLFMADDFTVWLSVGALLAGGIEATDIELRRPTVTLVLDGKGGGSWTGLSPDKMQTSFVPAKVAFEAVRVTDGTLAILAPDGSPKTSFEAINGEFSAQALQGPYRMAATFASRGAQREFRLSTAAPGDDGSVRFKGTVRDPGSGVSYSVDGTATDVLKTIKVAGELTARLPLPSAMVVGPLGDKEKIAAHDGSRKEAGPGEFDLRAELKGDTTGFELSDLSLSFEQAGKPQIATGSARVRWSGRTDVAVTLKSAWLDLDRIAGAGTGASALELTQGVANAVSRALETEGRTEASLAIDLATLGGDVISGLGAELEQTDGRLNVKTLTASLPGGARISAAGAFEGAGADLRYAGRVNLRGASLARFATWASRGQAAALPTKDGAFTVVGDITLGAKEIAGRNLSLEIGRNMLSGDASWKAGQPQRLTIALDGSELDVTPLVPPQAEPVQALRDLVAGLAGAKTSAVTAVGTADADIKLRVDRLVVGAAVYRDAVTELKLAGGNLSMPQLRLTSPEGFLVELRGDISDLAKPNAKGALTGLVVAETEAALTAFVRVANLPADAIPKSEEAAALVPARIAGRLAVGLKGPDTHDLAFDGTIGESRIAGTARLGAQKSGWRDRPTDVAVTLDGKGVVPLLARRLGTSVASLSAKEARATLTVRAIGSPQTGLASLVAIDADGAQAEYRGRVVLDDSGSLALDGELSLALDDLTRSLGIAGIALRPGLEGPLSGAMRIERSQGRTKLSSKGVMIAGTEASGQLVLEPAGDVQRVTGSVRLNQGSLPGMLTLLTAPASSGRRALDRASAWSEAPFDIGVVDRFAGSRVKVDAGQFVLAPGLEVADAALDVSVKTGGLDVRLTEAKAAGGQVSGSFVLDKAASGVRVALQGTLTGLKLERLAARGQQGQPAVTGGLTVNLKLDSAGLSPRGLVVTLAGGGDVSLTQAKLNRWNPGAVAIAAEAIMSLKGEVPAGALRAQLELAMDAGSTALGSPRLAATVADGTLRVAPLTATMPNGRLTTRLALDLDHVGIDADIRLEPRNTPQPAGLPAKGELPAVTIGYAGPLAALTRLEPRLDLDALEREVTVRKVERELAELERLRKSDEERVRQDAARIEAEKRALEQQRIEALSRPSDAPVSGAATNPAGLPEAKATQGGAAPTSTDGTAPASAQPAEAAPAAQAEPPTTVERRPLPRTSPTRAPARGNRDPFAGN